MNILFIIIIYYFLLLNYVKYIVETKFEIILRKSYYINLYKNNIFNKLFNL